MERADARGAFNLCAPEPLRNGELARVIGQVMRRPSCVPTPAFAMKLLLGDKAALVLDGQRQVPKRLLELGFQFQFPQAKVALQDLLK
jgi:NAD dependent epimerase/dehydratase family enzyme